MIDSWCDVKRVECSMLRLNFNWRWDGMWKRKYGARKRDEDEYVIWWPADWGSQNKLSFSPVINWLIFITNNFITNNLENRLKDKKKIVMNQIFQSKFSRITIFCIPESILDKNKQIHPWVYQSGWYQECAKRAEFQLTLCTYQPV